MERSLRKFLQKRLREGYKSNNHIVIRGMILLSEESLIISQVQLILKKAIKETIYKGFVIAYTEGYMKMLEILANSPYTVFNYDEYINEKIYFDIFESEIDNAEKSKWFICNFSRLLYINPNQVHPLMEHLNKRLPVCDRMTNPYNEGDVYILMMTIGFTQLHSIAKNHMKEDLQTYIIEIHPQVYFTTDDTAKKL